MASSGLKENVVPYKIVVRNVVLHNIFPMMVRGVMLCGYLLILVHSVIGPMCVTRVMSST